MQMMLKVVSHENFFRAILTCKDSSLLIAANAQGDGVLVNHYFL
jgi:hypothetical protein